MRSLFRPSLLALLLFVPGFRALAADPILKIAGPGQTLSFTAAEFAALPHTELKVRAGHDEAERTYAGVSMRELLTRAGTPLAEKFRGAALVTAVIVHSRDNYAVLFSLAEFDASFSSRTILLADQEDGQLLP